MYINLLYKSLSTTWDQFQSISKIKLFGQYLCLIRFVTWSVISMFLVLEDCRVSDVDAGLWFSEGFGAGRSSAVTPPARLLWRICVRERSVTYHWLEKKQSSGKINREMMWHSLQICSSLTNIAKQKMLAIFLPKGNDRLEWFKDERLAIFPARWSF